MQLGIRHFPLLPRVAAVWSWLRSVCEPYRARARAALGPYWQQAVEWYEKREPREKVLLRC